MFKSVAEAEKELEEVMPYFSNLHAEMQMNNEFYQDSVFWKSTKAAMDKSSRHVAANMLRVFGDKLITHTSKFPNFKVTPKGTDTYARQTADKREKLLYETHRASNTPLMQGKWADDAAIKGAAIATTLFNFKTRCVEVTRYDPRFAYWKWSNDNDQKLLAFWVAVPMSKSEVYRRFGKRVGNGTITPDRFEDLTVRMSDDEEYVYFVRRFDGKTRMAWAGDTWIENPHQHQMGIMPVDLVIPQDDGTLERLPKSYLRPLLALQCSLNESVRQKSDIVRRLGNPLVWGRGVMRNQLEPVKKALKGDAGFVGLKAQGELGLLQLPETKMIDSDIEFTIQTMMRISGFGAATFGESVGANTSGDALGMYFTPTTRLIQHQQIKWNAFYEGINYKILFLYQKFMKTNEEKRLTGSAPRGTVMGVYENSDGSRKIDYGQSTFDVVITKEDIGKNFDCTIIFEEPTPKDEIAYKRLLIEAVQQGFISRDTAYEDWGIESPQDELDKLKAERSDPAVNPEGVSRLIDASTKNQAVENQAAQFDIQQAQPQQPQPQGAVQDAGITPQSS